VWLVSVPGCQLEPVFVREATPFLGLNIGGSDDVLHSARQNAILQDSRRHSQRCSIIHGLPDYFVSLCCI
jgi:hypothetical protein